MAQIDAIGNAGKFGQETTTIEYYDPANKVDFTGNPPAKLTWLDDTHYLWPKADAKGKTTALLKVEAATGKTEPLFDAADTLRDVFALLAELHAR